MLLRLSWMTLRKTSLNQIDTRLRIATAMRGFKITTNGIDCNAASQCTMAGN